MRPVHHCAGDASLARRMPRTASVIPLIAVLCIALGACDRRGGYDAPEYKTAADAAKSGFVAPLEDDSAADIMSWVDGAPVTDWNAEARKREQAIDGYLSDADPGRAQKYGFRSGQTPKMAWDWFNNNPVGFNGVPYVLLKTIFDLDANDPNPTLRTIARIWKRQAVVPTAAGGSAWTMDHIGVNPPPGEYENGVARAPGPASVPHGFAFENPETFAPLDAVQRVALDARLGARDLAQKAFLLAAKLRTVDHEENWEQDRKNFGLPGSMDRVFFSCAACHVGRVMVGGKMKFLPGMPNTQIEAQYYSKLLMLTGASLVKSGFDPTSRMPVNPNNIEVNRDAVQALYGAMIDKALRRPETLYGSSPEAIARGKRQTLAVANTFPDVMKDLVAVAVKTHFIYYVVAKNNAYKAALPDVLEDRPGQMDAFGIASGLVAIHTRRPDNSYMTFVQRDNAKSPFFTGFSKANGLASDTPGMTEPVSDLKAAGDRVVKNLSAWAPPVPAPVDVKSVNWARQRYHANWDGNQGASSRTLASGASATGDPRMVNVRIHEPLNPFINNLPPPPYPFASVDLARAKEGKAIFKEQCAGCHKPNNGTIYSAKMLGVDPNRTMVNTDVSRYGLTALVMEACTIYGLNNEGKPGAQWCIPQGDWNARQEEYFRDTPRRVAEGTNGYKADMLYGIWAQAPYLHNGSVPTIGQLMCPSTRPARFLRGNLYYDEALVGFEWANRPTARYGPNDTILVKEYDTTVPSKANSGHTFGAALCPDTSGLDPTRDRKEIEGRVLGSRVGALLMYLKTL